MRVSRAALVVLLAACARHKPPVADVDDPAARDAAIAAALDGYSAHFLISWDGARIGEAEERFVADEDAEGGYRFSRLERTVVRREGARATARTEIVIDVDETLSARRVEVTRWVGSTRTQGTATRLVDEAWRVSFAGAPPRLVDGAAVPSTLVPLLVAASGRSLNAPVLVEGAGLATADLTVKVADGRAESLLATAAGTLRGTSWLDGDGFVVRAGGERGVSSRRVTADEAAAPFDPPELVDSSSVKLESASANPSRFSVEGLAPRRLIDLPGQRVISRAGALEVELAPATIRVPPELRAETHWVAKRLTDDPSLVVLAPEEALAAGRGDCTAHALVLEQRLVARGWETRLVTGFLVDGDALRRHRWLIVRVDGVWLPIDPIRDEAPARTPRIALAVHGADLDELAFVDDVAFDGWTGVRARVLR